MGSIYKLFALTGLLTLTVLSAIAEETNPLSNSLSLGLDLSSGTPLVPDSPLSSTAPATAISTPTANPTPTSPPPVPPQTGVTPPAGSNKPTSPQITLHPLPVPPKGTLGPLGFTIRAPWMTGDIRLRLPETLTSEFGLHFSDSKRTDMPLISMLETPPEWKTDAVTGDIWYETKTREGIVFGGKAHADTETVSIEFWIINATGNPISHVSPQMCLSLEGSPEFGRPKTLNTTYVWVNGAPFNLASTTPTPEQKGREPWIMMLTANMLTSYMGVLDHANGWWVVDQTADFNIIARASEDSKHLVAITWDETFSQLMTDTRIPCLHAGPIRAIPLQPQERGRWRGRIYLVPNDMNQLLARYLKDAEGWFSPGK